MENTYNIILAKYMRAVAVLDEIKQLESDLLGKREEICTLLNPSADERTVLAALAHSQAVLQEGQKQEDSPAVRPPTVPEMP